MNYGNFEGFSEYTITCFTEGCFNYSHPIILWAATVNPTVICGPCGNEVTSVVPIVS